MFKRNNDGQLLRRKEGIKPFHWRVSAGEIKGCVDMPARRELRKLSKVDNEHVPASIKKHIMGNFELLGHDRDETNPPLPKGCVI